MSVKRKHIVTHKLPKKTISKKLVVTAVILIGLALAGLVAAKTMMKTAQVALLTTMPVPLPSPICGNITQFNVTAQCGTTAQFHTATYTCTTMNGVQTIGTPNMKPTAARPVQNGCQNVSALYATAYKTCSTTCLKPSPTPVPSMTPPPKPTSTPSPSTPPQGSPSPTPACTAQKVTHYAYRELCPYPADNGRLQYHFIDYTCGNETTPRVLGSSDYCTFDSSFLASAQYFCMKNACSIIIPSSTPSSTAVPRPTGVPTK